MTNYGIYKLRQIKETLRDHIQTDFYKQVQRDVVETNHIYESNLIICPDMFLGINLMGKHLQTENIISYLKEHLKESEHTSIELMCHPGDKSDYFDEFNQSDERVHEKEFLLKNLDEVIQQIQSEFACDVELTNFDSLEPKLSDSLNVLLYGKLTLGTGNHITMMRYKDILQGQNIDGKTVNVYTKHICEVEDEVQDLENFVKTFRINVILGINIFRVGLVFTKFEAPPKIITVAGGTDVNHFIQVEGKRDIILKTIQMSLKVLCLSQDMKNKLLENLSEVSE